jgi:hypothetical protein
MPELCRPLVRYPGMSDEGAQLADLVRGGGLLGRDLAATSKSLKSGGSAAPSVCRQTPTSPVPALGWRIRAITVRRRPGHPALDIRPASPVLRNVLCQRSGSPRTHPRGRRGPAGHDWRMHHHRRRPEAARTGDAVVIAPGTRHAIHHDGDEPCEVIGRPGCCRCRTAA